MSISPSSEPYRSISRSEFLSSLPRWRRWLALLNWRPVVDLEIRAIEREKLLFELRSDSEQLRRENARYAELNARLDAICFSFDASSPPPPTTPGPSPI
jgi:hypothetical protein